MSHFSYRDNTLFAEDVSAIEIARSIKTPTYVYSRQAIETEFLRYYNACDERDLICYAVKANSNLAVLDVLARLGAGFDIVSGGELARVIAAGGDPAKVVFSGVAKASWEIERALEAGIHCFNVESAAELERIHEVATRLGKKAPISLRINPDVDAKTHPYISTGLKDNKFGVAMQHAVGIYEKAAAMPLIEIKGIDCHIGSQIVEDTPFLDALDRVLTLVDALTAKGITLSHVDLGGGIGVQYQDETPPDIEGYIQKAKAKLATLGVSLILEPGRSIVANAGILLTQVEYLKDTGDKHFAIVDAAMNDLLRPALYQSFMKIAEVEQKDSLMARDYDIVGPVCETGDFLGKHRSLRTESGDFLAVFSAGAYGFGMASNYNTRPRAAEVMVDGDQYHVIREREKPVDLYRGEQRLPDNT